MLTNTIEPTWIELLEAAECFGLEDRAVVDTWRSLLRIPRTQPTGTDRSTAYDGLNHQT